MSQNVFKNPDGTLIARRINREEIMPTIQWLEQITGLDFTEAKDKNGIPVKWLGTTGRKPSSGDLDLSVDEGEISKEELRTRLANWAKKSGVADANIMNSKANRAGWIQLSGDNVHFRAPIMGDPSNGYVQADFMFSADPRWQQWSMRGGLPDSPYKGMHRHILLASIARAQNLKYSYKNALIDPATEQTITKDPNEIAQALLGPGARAQDLETTEAILQKIKSRPDYAQLTQAARETLAREGVILPESLQVGSADWFRTLMDSLTREELILNKETPSIEQIAKKHNKTIDYIQQQLTKGISIEYEHTNDRSTATEIALDHLNERPDYYIKLAKIEKK